MLTAFERTPPETTWKADGTVVTDLDHDLEEYLGAALLGIDPAFGLVSEEGGEIRAGRPVWHLDPLDGSLNFARRLPLFVCQAALIDGDEILFSAVYEPVPDAFAWAAPGAGAWRDGRRLQVADRGIREAVVLVDLARSGALVTEAGLFARLRRRVYRVRALGSTGLHLAAVASGYVDGAVALRTDPSPLHDVAPGLLLVREAGGVATTVRGGDPLRDRRTLLAAGPRVHPHLLEALRGRA